jgi:hypothetical protein
VRHVRLLSEVSESAVAKVALQKRASYLIPTFWLQAVFEDIENGARFKLEHF